MARRIENSPLTLEIKKEYLKEHLKNVKQSITSWIPQLSAPSPLAPREGLFGWQSVYRSPTEEDSDNNHILRRHLRSRSLWSHHANWERKLDDIWDMTNQVRKQADHKHAQLSGKEQRQYNEYYVGTALWKGFEMVYGVTIEILYKVPEDERGVAYGAYKIEMSAASPDERSSIEQEHRGFIHHLAVLKEMKELAGLWHEVEGMGEQMQAIAGKILKSNDILYPCRFCRHLWR